jgi:energy-converting hydrogenase Eha subunit A
MKKLLGSLAVRVGLLVFVALSLLGHHSWGTVDAIQRLALTRSLFLRGSVLTPEFGPIKYGLVQPVAMAPFYLAGHAVGRITGQDPERVGYRATAFFFTPLVVAVLAASFLTTSLGLGWSRQSALLGTWALVFGTLLTPYSRILFAEPLQALLLFLGVTKLFLATDRRWRGFLWLGLLTLNNLAYDLLFLVATALASWTAYRRDGRAGAISTLASGIAVLLATSAVWTVYNVARYGSAWSPGYAGETFSTPIWTGLAGLLVSPGRGLLWYAPFTALTIGLFALRRPQTGEAVTRTILFSLSVFTLYLCFYATWGSFEGGWCWGPRFLLPFVPLIHLASIPLFEDRPSRAWTGRILLAGCALGVLGNAWEFAIDWQRWEKQTFGDGRVDYLRSVWEPALASALHGWAGHDSLLRIAQFGLVSGLTWLALSRLEELRPASAEASSGNR